MIYLLDKLAIAFILMRFVTQDMDSMQWYAYVYPTLFFFCLGIRSILTVSSKDDSYFYSHQILERDHDWWIIGGVSLITLSVIIPIYFFFRDFL
jgi:hypothetical protein